MKKYYVFFVLLAVFSSCTQKEPENKEPERIVLAYVFGDRLLPDPNIVTHINYAFGHVTDTYDGVRINSEEQLRAIVALKQQKPSLKVLLSIGGWGSGRFSEMAAVGKFRQAFAADCKRVVDEFGLDGIDLDWEYPTESWAADRGLDVSYSPEDYGNYTLLSIDIRKAIGKDKLLTMATLASADPIIDLETINQYYDFFNIMTYDLAMTRPDSPPGHQGALYKSDKVIGMYCDESVKRHIAAGIPAEKLNLGVLFGGRGGRVEGLDPLNLTVSEGFTIQWDDDAKASYVTNSEGVFVRSFECARAIEAKCDFVKEHGLLGLMYWSYNNQAPVFSKLMYDRLIDNIAKSN